MQKIISAITASTIVVLIVISYMRSPTLDDWYWWLQSISVGLVFATFIVGAITLLVGKEIKKRDDRTLSETNERSMKLELDAETQKRLTAEATERTEKLEVEAVKLRERAAIAERDLLVIKQQVAPRILSQSSKEKLVGLLKDSPNKQRIEIECVSGDAEGNSFARQVDDVLRTAGWATSGVSQGVYGGGNPKGFILRVRSASDPQARDLQRAFSSVGFPLYVHEGKVGTSGAASIIVGIKPQ